MSTRYMKAIQVKNFGAPEVLRVEDIPVPQPGPGQVLVKVHAAGVNPVETYIRSGNYAALPNLPWIPGKDGAGTVETLGEGVTNVKVNDRVWLSSVQTGTGTYAQYCLSPAEGVHRLPEPFTFSQGASLWTAYATAYHGLFHVAEPVPVGGTILVHGASGGVGMASIQWAKLIPGSSVLGTAGTEEGMKLILENGATAFNHRESGYTEKILSKTENKGVDIILEMLANINLNNDLQLLANNGKVCIIGNRGTIDGFNPRILMQRRASVRGVMLNTITEKERKEIIDAIELALKDNKINPALGKEYPLSLASEAHKDILNPPGGGSGGKIVINPWA